MSGTAIRFDRRRGIVWGPTRRKRPHPIEGRSGQVTARYETRDGEWKTVVAWVDRGAPTTYHRDLGLDVGTPVRLTLARGGYKIVAEQ
jgi:hypothetical protein